MNHNLQPHYELPQGHLLVFPSEGGVLINRTRVFRNIIIITNHPTSNDKDTFLWNIDAGTLQFVFSYDLLRGGGTEILPDISKAFHPPPNPLLLPWQGGGFYEVAGLFYHARNNWRGGEFNSFLRSARLLDLCAVRIKTPAPFFFIAAMLQCVCFPWGNLANYVIIYWRAHNEEIMHCACVPGSWCNNGILNGKGGGGRSALCEIVECICFR